LGGLFGSVVCLDAEYKKVVASRLRQSVVVKLGWEWSVTARGAGSKGESMVLKKFKKLKKEKNFLVSLNNER
jgi:hypothetical protein